MVNDAFEEVPCSGPVVTLRQCRRGRRVAFVVMASVATITSATARRELCWQTKAFTGVTTTSHAALSSRSLPFSSLGAKRPDAGEQVPMSSSSAGLDEETMRNPRSRSVWDEAPEDDDAFSQGGAPGSRGAPPRETGRNPQAVGEGLASYFFQVPAAVIGFLLLFILAGWLRFALAPTPQVTLGEALGSLVSLEEEFDALGPERMGLRSKVTKWFGWAQLDRRLDLELAGLPESPAKKLASEKGKSAVEYLASVVEYSGWISTNLDDMRAKGDLGDEIAKKQAAMGITTYQDMSAKALIAGREALSTTVRAIDDAKDAKDMAEAREQEKVAEAKMLKLSGGSSP